MKHFVAVLLVAAAGVFAGHGIRPDVHARPAPRGPPVVGAPGRRPDRRRRQRAACRDRVRRHRVAFDHAGREVWRTHVAGAGLDWPVIDGDLVVVPVTTATGAACVALEQASGAERWQADAGPGIVAATTAGGGRVVSRAHAAAWSRSKRASGAVLWSRDTEAYFDAGPVDVSPPAAVAVDPTSHPPLPSAPHHAAGVVTVVIRVRGHWIFSCWDLATGTEARCGLDLGGVAPASAVAGAGNSVFVVGSGSSHEVALIDVDARQVRAAVATADAFDPANIPLVTGGIAVVVDRSGQVTAVDVATGRRRWQAALGTPILDAKPAAAAGVVRIVDWTGRVFALRLADGHRAAPVNTRGGTIGVVADPAARWWSRCGAAPAASASTASFPARSARGPVGPGRYNARSNPGIDPARARP